MDILTFRTVLLLVLFLTTAVLFLLLGRRIGIDYGRKVENADWEKNKLDKIVAGRIKTSRAVLGGQFSEQIAPYLPDFPYNPGDCRFIGKPIDLLIFKGMDSKEIDEVIFLEIKSGKNKALSPQEKRLRVAVEAGRVRWEQYNVDYSSADE